MIGSWARALAIIGGFDAVWLVAACDVARGGDGSFGLIGALGYVATLAAAGRLGVADFAGVMAAGVAGAAIETMFVNLGVVAYAPPPSNVGHLPMWIVGIWLAFAASILALRLRDVVPPATIMALSLGAPLAYLAGDRIGALKLAPLSLGSWAAISLSYAVALALLRRLAHCRSRENDPTSQETSTL